MAVFDILRQGDSYEFDITYPIGTDITGFRFTFTMKASFDDTDEQAVLQHTHIAGSGDLDNATNGYCLVHIPPSKTVIPKGAYYFDLQAVSLSGDIETLAPPKENYKQKITVIPQVTRATT